MIFGQTSKVAAVEKDTEKWAAGKFLGPSYFEATLHTAFCLNFLKHTLKRTFMYLEIYLEIQNLENLSYSKGLISSKLVSKKRYQIWIKVG